MFSRRIILKICTIVLAITFLDGASVGKFSKRSTCSEKWLGQDGFKDILKKLKSEIKNSEKEIDPLRLDNKEIGFSYTKYFVHVRAEAKLYNGYIIGLSKIYEDMSTFDCEEKKNGAQYSITFGIPKLQAHYAGHVKIFGIGPSGAIEAILKEPKLELTILQPTTGNATLAGLKLSSEEINLKFSGWSVISSIITLITKPFVSFFESYIHSKIQPELVKFVKPLVGKIALKSN